MSDKMRWRYGETNPVMAAANSAAIEIGDLVYFQSGAVFPAAALPASGMLATVQDSFAQKFLGVAMQRSPLSDTSPIRVATSGVFEMDTVAAIYEIGDKVGVVKKAAITELESQSITKSTANSGSIGRVCRRETVANTTVLVAIQSVIMNGTVT